MSGTVFPNNRWPHDFDILAEYNAEVYRGIVHTEAWQSKMCDLQAKYDKWIKTQWPLSTSPQE